MHLLNLRQQQTDCSIASCASSCGLKESGLSDRRALLSAHAAEFCLAIHGIIGPSSHERPGTFAALKISTSNVNSAPCKKEDQADPETGQVGSLG